MLKSLVSFTPLYLFISLFFILFLLSSFLTSCHLSTSTLFFFLFLSFTSFYMMFFSFSSSLFSCFSPPLLSSLFPSVFIFPFLFQIFFLLCPTLSYFFALTLFIPLSVQLFSFYPSTLSLFSSQYLWLHLSFFSSLCIFPIVCSPVPSCRSRFLLFSFSVLELIHLESALKHRPAAPPLLFFPLFYPSLILFFQSVAFSLPLSLLHSITWISFSPWFSVFFSFYSPNIPLCSTLSLILSILCSGFSVLF